MKEQNFKNHTQIVYSYYLFTGVPILALVGIAISKIFRPEERNLGIIIFLIGWVLLSLMFRSRGFGLKAQDRAIRSEETLRYFILTGKQLDQRLTLRQIIALRFASDQELPGLAQKAADENLPDKAIKMQIKNWRGDWNRV